MAKVSPSLALILLLLVLGCTAAASSAVNSHTEAKLKAAGCDYRMGKVEIRDEFVSTKDKADGITSRQAADITFAIRPPTSKDPTGEYQDVTLTYFLTNGELRPGNANNVEDSYLDSRISKLCP